MSEIVSGVMSAVRRRLLPRRLVYVAPCVPARGGGGLAMRCGLMLDAAAEHFEVSLAVVPLINTGSVRRAEEDPWVRARAREVMTFVDPPAPRVPQIFTHPGDRALGGWSGETRPDLWSAQGALLPSVCRGLSRHTAARLSTWVTARAPRVVMVSRLYIAAALQAALAEQRTRFVLDLDDNDASFATQVARLYGEYGDAAMACRWLGEAQRYSLLSRALIPRFDATLVAAPGDVDAIAVKPRGGAHTFVPNAIDGFAEPVAKPPRAFDLLFVGSLGYLPNVQGICWFVEHVMPRLRARRPETTLTIAGRGPDPAVARLGELPGVRVIADPPDVAPLYAEARVAVCPLFVGAGSRIKLLEAFAAGVPVVTTTPGAAGLALRPGEHALFADEPEAMAEACLALIGDEARAATIAEAARRLAVSEHGRGAVKEKISLVLA